MKLHLFDIEGTIAPITFVHDVLFPYSIQEMDRFIQQNPDEVETIVEFLKNSDAQYQPNFAYEENADGVIAVLKYWIRNDFKIGPLKTVQGKIWKEGFESGNICGRLYDDAINFILRCTNDKFAIYSSGSVMVSELYIVVSNLLIRLKPFTR